ncbi:hypothetical protein L798_07593, partial [Zootermopsis nevadensis]
FCRCGGTSKRRLMTAAQFVEFLNKTQRDPRLNEILYPYANTSRAKDLVQQYEPNKYNAQRGQFSFDGFLRYLMSEDNPIVSPSELDLSDDMDQPLPHYFINSSHNTYLTGHQLTGKSSVEMYRQCLLAGCRCVELDFWNGRTEEPVIVHGYTLVPDISAKEVIEAIADSAFKTSDYPVILSFENHCNPRQQAKIAQYCREIFGEKLLDSPIDSHKLEPGTLLPPPSLLKGKIIIKNKKKHHHHHHHHTDTSQSNSQSSLQQDIIGSAVGAAEVEHGNGDIPHHPALQVRQSSKESAHEEDENDDEEESSSAEEVEEDGPGEIKLRLQEKPSSDKVSAAKESEAGAEISALVNYVQPVHFSSFENSEKKNRCYEMSSFDERQATTLLKERPIEFVNYNKHQLSRVYPAGTRFDSSNFMPQVFWNAGCQLVALNYQTLDLAMQLNLGMFEYNHQCGYLLKPEFMRRRDRRLDPFAESTVDGIIAGTVQVTVISGQFLTDKRVGTYVEVDMYGLPADTVRKKFRTRIVPANGINPTYDEEPFVFKKVVLPELASIRLTAYEDSGRFIGHRVLPVVGLCPGYRHVMLRTESGQPLPLATLFLLIVVKDYVPDGLSDFAEALANPIKYQSELEKRAQQLAVLTDDLDVIEEPPGKLPASEMVRPIPSPRPSIVGGLESPIVENISEPETGSVVVPSEPATQNEQPTSPQGPPAPVKAPSKSNDAILLPTLSEDLVAEPLEKFMENKVVKEKLQEMDKKLETLKKKHEKEKGRVQTHGKTSSHHDNDRKKKFYGSMLVKRLSSKNIQKMFPLSEILAWQECESDASKAAGLPRSQSERLLSLCKDYINHEKELREKYHALIFQTVEKLMKTSQCNQLKLLSALLERETADVMRRLEAVRRGEVKALSKVHRDKDEMIRIKREVASSMVEKGVHERVRLTKIYEKRREELQRQHEEVRLSLEERKHKV